MKSACISTRGIGSRRSSPNSPSPSDQGDYGIEYVCHLRMQHTPQAWVSASATTVVTNPDGTIRQDPPRATKWHESFRYLRLSQATDDLFDAYRNAYLALESILSTITPQKSKGPGKAGESEGQWLKRALTKADTMTDLRSLVPYPVEDPVNYFFDDSILMSDQLCPMLKAAERYCCHSRNRSVTI